MKVLLSTLVFVFAWPLTGSAIAQDELVAISTSRLIELAERGEAPERVWVWFAEEIDEGMRESHLEFLRVERDEPVALDAGGFVLAADGGVSYMSKALVSRKMFRDSLLASGYVESPLKRLDDGDLLDVMIAESAFEAGAFDDAPAIGFSADAFKAVAGFWSWQVGLPLRLPTAYEWGMAAGRNPGRGLYPFGDSIADAPDGVHWVGSKDRSWESLSSYVQGGLVSRPFGDDGFEHLIGGVSEYVGYSSLEQEHLERYLLGKLETDDDLDVRMLLGTVVTFRGGGIVQRMNPGVAWPLWGCANPVTSRQITPEKFDSAYAEFSPSQFWPWGPVLPVAYKRERFRFDCGTHFFTGARLAFSVEDLVGYPDLVKQGVLNETRFFVHGGVASE